MLAFSGPLRQISGKESRNIKCQDVDEHRIKNVVGAVLLRRELTQPQKPQPAIKLKVNDCAIENGAEGCGIDCLLAREQDAGVSDGEDIKERTGRIDAAGQQDEKCDQEE